MAKLCMLVSNGVLSDPRVTKEAASLSPYHDVFVVGISKEELVGEPQPGNYTVRLAKEPSLPLQGTLGKAARKMIGCLRMTRLAYLWRADVYHAHDLDMLPFAYLLSAIRGAKLVYDSHELWAEQRADFPGWFKKMVMNIERLLIRRSDRVITVNHSIATELKERYRLQTLPVIIHNFSKKAPLELVQREGASVTVLYHGGYMNDRGLEEFVDSAAHLTSGTRIILRGMGPLENRLRAMIADISSGAVELLPPVSMKALVREAAQSDIGIIPYKPTCLNNYYSLPNKLSEYAMAGLAICASDLPEIRRIVVKHQMGELFDPNDPMSIAAAIDKLASDPEYLERCKRNARAWAESEGNWEFEQLKLLKLYNELLGESDEKAMDR